MATKSILKNVNIKNKDLAKGLVDALENAQNKKAKVLTPSKQHRKIKPSQIKGYFNFEE